mmetsp:Transcript_11607/g.21768  ORF Transcript_11607/g.21768 Transcript_11607/m.21768 type:complete len:237 (+) Transcript_11607:95-805(+)
MLLLSSLAKSISFCRAAASSKFSSAAATSIVSLSIVMVIAKCLLCSFLASESATDSSPSSFSTISSNSDRFFFPSSTLFSKSIMDVSAWFLSSIRAFASDENLAASLKFFFATAAFFSSSSFGIFSSAFLITHFDSSTASSMRSSSSLHSVNSLFFSSTSTFKPSVFFAAAFSSSLKSLSVARRESLFFAFSMSSFICDSVSIDAFDAASESIRNCSFCANFSLIFSLIPSCSDFS